MLEQFETKWKHVLTYHTLLEGNLISYYRSHLRISLSDMKRASSGWLYLFTWLRNDYKRINKNVKYVTIILNMTRLHSDFYENMSWTRNDAVWESIRLHTLRIPLTTVFPVSLKHFGLLPQSVVNGMKLCLWRKLNQVLNRKKNSGPKLWTEQIVVIG